MSYIFKFRSNNIKIIDYPSKSPDLNYIENMWSEVSRLLYGKGKSYCSKEKFSNEIKLKFNSVRLERKEYLRL